MPSQKVSGHAAKLKMGGMVLALAAAALAVFAVFQTAFQSRIEFPVISPGNTLIQKESGWPILACAVGIVVSVCLYRLDDRRGMLWAFVVVGLGAAIFGATIYQETGGREIVAAGGGALLTFLSGVHGYPAIGLKLAKVAGTLAMVSGFMLASVSLGPPSRVSPRRSPSQAAR